MYGGRAEVLIQWSNWWIEDFAHKTYLEAVKNQEYGRSGLVGVLS